MKLSELLIESVSDKEANVVLEKEAQKILSFFKNVTDEPSALEKTSSGFKIFNIGFKLPMIYVSANTSQVVVNHPQKGTVPTIFMSISLDIDKKFLFLKQRMKDFIKENYNRTYQVFDSPWYHNDHSTYTVSDIQIAKLDFVPLDTEPTLASSEDKPRGRYDPEAEYYSRATAPSKSMRATRSMHQFRSSIGGDSSNYRSESFTPKFRVGSKVEIIASAQDAYGEPGTIVKIDHDGIAEVLLKSGQTRHSDIIHLIPARK